jgi:UDP-3-O-[3-hydroxymyristoyl] glucosamine N-acyltransferase
MILLSNLIENLNLVDEKIIIKKYIINEDYLISNFILPSENIKKNQIMWLNKNNLDILKNIKHGTIIAPYCSDEMLDINFSGTLIMASNPRLIFKNTIKFFKKNCNMIGINNVIEDDVVIGDNVIIGHNNVIYSGTVIGNNCIIGSNNTIGGSGFGYEKTEDGYWEKIEHIGNVILYNNVEIGSNNAIDRGVIGSTIIGSGTKIDNLVHIAHNVNIGKNCMIIAKSMIGGSTIIGDDTWIAPSSSLINKISLGKNVTVGMGSVVLKNVEEGATVVGVPAKNIKLKT